jgi:phage terminase large subunit
MAALDLKTSDVFQKNWDILYERNNKRNDVKFIINQGGTSSGKTIAILQCAIVFALTHRGSSVSICRISLPILKRSVIRDFVNLLKDMDMYYESDHNKTEQIYTFKNGSYVEFVACIEEDKLKGPRRDLLILNECTELSKGMFLQLAMRTRGVIMMDFNPEDNDHWIYEVINEPNAILIKSTYKDNPFLTESNIKFIEDMIKVDDNYYKTYVLGERPTSNCRIYSHFRQSDEIPMEINKDGDEVVCDKYCYGLDFGYNHPTVLVKTTFVGNAVYIREEIYRSNLTAVDLIDLMNDFGINKSKYIYCDSSRPEIIEELNRSGYKYAKGADKNVKAGIDKVKSHEIIIHNDSLNIWKEYKKYNWKMDGERILDEPAKIYDDAMDAIRYAIHSHIKVKKFTPIYANIYK